MSKKQSKAEREAAAQSAATAELAEKQLWAGWLKKTRRTKTKSAKTVQTLHIHKETDLRYFVVLREDDKIFLTWTKNDDPINILTGDHYHAVSEITVECRGWQARQKSPATQAAEEEDDFSFMLKLPPDSKPHKKRAKKPDFLDGESVEVAVDDPTNTVPLVLFGLFKVLIGAKFHGKGRVSNIATIAGGAPTEVDKRRKPLQVLQTSNTMKNWSTGAEYKLDDDNCLADFGGSLLKVKGIAIGLRLGAINDVEIFGWPRPFVEQQFKDTTQLPITCSFYTCEKTQLVVDETIEHSLGKVAVVVGACGAIGRAAAQILAVDGADVALIDADAAAVEGVAAELVELLFHDTAQMEFAKRKVKSYAHDRDLTNEPFAAQFDLVYSILEDFGKIDILVNAVSVGAEPFVVSGSAAPADFLSDVERHLKVVGAYSSMTSAVVQKAMLPASSGCVIGLCSAMGRESLDRTAEDYHGEMSFGFGYSMKALEGMSSALAREHVDSGVRFNLLAPMRTAGDNLAGVSGSELEPSPEGAPESLYGRNLKPLEDAQHIKSGLLMIVTSDALNGEIVDAQAEMVR